MKVTVEKLPKSQLKLVVKVDKNEVEETYQQVLQKNVETTEIEGFRKGKAPKQKVEQKVGVSKLYGDTINELLQKYYPQAIKENYINPISNPKVEIKEFELNKDFEFDAIVALKPEIKIGDFRKELKKYYEEKNKQVKLENAERLKKGEKLEHDHAHIHPSEIIDQLLNVTEVELPDILIEEETNRTMSRLVDQINATGMKVEDYLKAQSTTIDQLKENYDRISERSLKTELILGDLVKQEKVTVEEKEIDNAIMASGVENPQELLNNTFQRVYIRTILEKNKLVTKLMEETEGENHAK